MVFLKSLWYKTIEVVLDGARLEGERQLGRIFNNASKNMHMYVFSQNEGKHFCCVICFSVLFKGLKWHLFTR